MSARDYRASFQIDFWIFVKIRVNSCRFVVSAFNPHAFLIFAISGTLGLYQTVNSRPADTPWHSAPE